MALAGSATITWNSGSNSHDLSVPLQTVRPAYNQPQVVAEPLDLSAREVYNFGAGVYEVVAVVRYSEKPEELIEVIRAGMRGEVLTYNDPDRSISGLEVDLIEPMAKATIDRETQPWGRIFFWGSREIRLRRTDGSAFPAALFH